MGVTMIRLAIALGLVYVLYCAGLFFLQRQLLYPGTGIRTSAVPGNAPPAERIWLETGSGKVEAWLLPVEGQAGRVLPGLIFAHGNGELIDAWAGPFSELSRRGIRILLVEYPGFGRSEGQPTQETITKAFIGAYDLLAGRPDVDPRRIVLWGRSLGGGAVCALLGERPAAALILMSTFTSVRSMASRFLVPSFLVRDPFDNLSAVAGFRGPVLIAHGRQDRIIPYRHALRLHEAAAKSQLVSFDAGHNNCPPDWKAFLDEVESFLRVEAGVLPVPN